MQHVFVVLLAGVLFFLSMPVHQLSKAHSISELRGDLGI